MEVLILFDVVWFLQRKLIIFISILRYILSRMETWTQVHRRPLAFNLVELILLLALTTTTDLYFKPDIKFNIKSQTAFYGLYPRNFPDW